MSASWPQGGFIFNILSNKTKPKQNKKKNKRKKENNNNNNNKMYCVNVLITNVN